MPSVPAPVCMEYQSVHPTLVRVEWYDTTAFEGWHAPEDVDTFHAVRVVSAGCLLHSDDNELKLTTGYIVCDEHAELDRVMHVTVIPRSAIVSFRVLTPENEADDAGE